MQTTNLTEQLNGLIAPLLESINLRLWGLEFVGAVLRVYIEKEAVTEKPGIDASAMELASIDDCAEASRLIGLTLDVEDIIESAYVLEVSTPGLERRFFTPEQMPAYCGRLIEALLSRSPSSHPKRKKFVGRLVAADQGDAGWTFTLALLETSPTEAERVSIDWSTVKKARLLYEAPATQRSETSKQDSGSKGKIS